MVLILFAGCISLKGPAGNEGSIGVPGRPGRKVTKLLRCYVTDDEFSSSFDPSFDRNSSKLFLVVIILIFSLYYWFLVSFLPRKTIVI